MLYVYVSTRVYLCVHVFKYVYVYMYTQPIRQTYQRPLIKVEK